MRIKRVVVLYLLGIIHLNRYTIFDVASTAAASAQDTSTPGPAHASMAAQRFVSPHRVQMGMRQHGMEMQGINTIRDEHRHAYPRTDAASP